MGRADAAHPPDRQTFPSLDVWSETTAYEALHLAFDDLARLAEALRRSYGKQGELIAYDVLRAERVAAGGGKTGSVAEFIADFTAQPREAGLFTAGLTTKLIHVSEREAVLQSSIASGPGTTGSAIHRWDT